MERRRQRQEIRWRPPPRGRGGERRRAYVSRPSAFRRRVGLPARCALVGCACVRRGFAVGRLGRVAAAVCGADGPPVSLRPGR
eukprot:3846689-Lingulodinium_polyedra.AAC.1